MKKKTAIVKNVEITYKRKDGKTSVIDRKVSSENKDSFVVKVFKRVIFSLDKTRYDLFEVTSSTIKIFLKSVEKMSLLDSNFNLATEGIDDDGD